MNKKEFEQSTLENVLKLGKDINTWEGGYQKTKYNAGKTMWGWDKIIPAREYNLVGEKNGLKLNIKYEEVFGGFQFDGSYAIELKDGEKILFSKSDNHGRSHHIEKLARDKTAQILKRNRAESNEIKISNKLKEKLVWPNTKNLKKLSLDEAIELVGMTPNFTENTSYWGHEGWNYANSWLSKDEIEERGPNQYIREITKSFKGKPSVSGLNLSFMKAMTSTRGSDAGEEENYTLVIEDSKNKNNSVTFKNFKFEEVDFMRYSYHDGHTKPKLKKLFSALEKSNSSSPKLTAGSIKQLEEKEKNRIKKLHALMIQDLTKKDHYANRLLEGYKVEAKTGTEISKRYTDHTTTSEFGKSLNISKGKKGKIVVATLRSGGNYHFHSFFGNSDGNLEPEKDWNIRWGSFQIPLKEYDKIIKHFNKDKTTKK